MEKRKSVYVYPFTPVTQAKGGNDYITNLLTNLEKEFEIVNKKETRLGLLDVLLKLSKSDILYFNWIEELPDKRFASVQLLLLWIILHASSLFRIKVIWFIHNNISHYHKNLWLKELIVSMMGNHAHFIFSHSREVKLPLPENKHYVFHHPIDAYKALPGTTNYEYDLLIWGKISPYKGVEDFLRFNHSSKCLKRKSILVAGKFSSEDSYKKAMSYQASNVTIINEVIEEKELISLFAKSKYILFAYNSSSVVSSGALCKSLSYGKAVIGPAVGSFKDLSEQKLLYTYSSYGEIASIIAAIEQEKMKVNESALKEYVSNTSWEHFCGFVTKTIR